MILWVIGFIVAAVLLSLLVEFTLERFNIRPVDESARSGGARDVLAKLREWSGNRKTGA
jgi:hypothetical protein